MGNWVQNTMDFVSVWGPWLLGLLLLASLAGLWRRWRRDRNLPTRTRVWRTVRSWWTQGLCLAGVGLFLLQFQLAPLTRSLAKLHAGQGDPVPNLSFHRVTDGAPFELHQFEGKVVVLNLWATYCPPCVEELPRLARLQADYAEREVVVIALSDEPRETVQGFLERHPVELLVATTESTEWLRLEAFRPLTLVVDRRGTLRGHAFGALSYETFEAGIRPYL